MKSRKEIHKKSTKKRNEKLKELGLVAINTHIRKEDKEKLVNIQKEKNFNLLGDAISFYINIVSAMDN